MAFKSRTGAFYLLFIVFLAFSFLTRAILLVKALPNLDPGPLLPAKIFGAGLFFDCVTFSYFVIPFALYALFVPDRVFRCKPVAWVVCFSLTYLLMFNIIAEYVFFDEFGSRYNFIAIDYLVYTTEVIRNIRESYPINWILCSVFVLNAIIFVFIRKPFERACVTETTLMQRLKRGWVFALLPVLAFLFVDISMTVVSPNNYANELAGNGFYNLVAAFRNNELDYDKFYAAGNPGTILARLKQMLKDEDEVFLPGEEKGIGRAVKADGPEQRLNVLVIVEESMSAEFLGTFGNNLHLTPNIDRLATESLLFTNLYATGTRTVRGLEAITLSMPPLPGSSVIKRQRNENLFSWGSLMNSKGYDSKFIYGGKGYFDNMNYFFSHNGFGIVDKGDFGREEITFENAWGVCDEDLFMKVIKEADKSVSIGKPFFSIVMTTSNHRPFTYPGGKVYVPSGSGREGGVMYADYAIGRLMAEARKQPWFDRTVFVIIADHCADSARKYALPVQNYRIPLIIYAPSLIAPRKVDTLASQIDVAPTVLGLLNFSFTSRFVGTNILDADIGPKRAFISTYEKLGLLEDDKLLVLSPKKGVSFFRFDRTGGNPKEIPPREDLLKDALGFYQGASDLYKNRLDRLDPIPSPGPYHASGRHLAGKTGT